MLKSIKFLISVVFFVNLRSTINASSLAAPNSTFYPNSEETGPNTVSGTESVNYADGKVPGQDFNINFKNRAANQKPTYFDLTEALNAKNLSEIESTLNITSHVYYSTDKPITAIKDLEWIPNILSSLYISESENPDICLTIGFQMTKNRSDINWRHIQDILSISKLTDQDETPLLHKYLCGVVLDFQLGSTQNHPEINPESFLYIKKWDISFTKFTKKVLKNIFQNKTVPVGVIYNEVQLDELHLNISEILRLQEFQFADFAYINLDYFPVIRMPLDFLHFSGHLDSVKYKNGNFLTRHRSNRGNFTYHSVDSINIPVEYMLTWRSGQDVLDNFQIDQSSYKNVLQSSDHEYLSLFHDFVHTTVSSNYFKIGVISGSTFDVNHGTNKIFSKEAGNRHILPSLFIQEADANTCDIVHALYRLSKPYYDAVIVNEFTWSTLARNEANINELEVTSCLGFFPEEIKTPQNILLFVTRGIGKHWDAVSQTFINLLENHSSIADMNLTRIVISADDLPEHSEDMNRNKGEQIAGEISRSPSNFADISEYAKALGNAGNLSVGCVVDLTRESINHPNKIFELTFKRCSPTYYKIPFFVWKYTINSTTILENQFRNGGKHEDNLLMRRLFTMLAARQLMKSYVPAIEVIFQIEMEKTTVLDDFNKWGGCWMRSTEAMELESVLEKWAGIHKVQIIKRQDGFNTHCMMF